MGGVEIAVVVAKSGAEKINRYLLEQKSKLILYQNMHSTYIKKAHASAIDQYQNPKKEEVVKESPEEVAHKAAWLQ